MSSAKLVLCFFVLSAALASAGTPRTCPEHLVACSTGSCLSPYWACDGDKHCPGGEDEQNCGTPRTCPEHWVACSTGRCVPPFWACDGDKDCPGGEDEQNCGTPRTCPEHYVACSTGRCVPPVWVCDGRKSCPGGEDEQHCGSLLNATTTTSTTTTEKVLSTEATTATRTTDEHQTSTTTSTTSTTTGQHVEITPRMEVRPVGGEVTVLCKVAFPIESCRMIIGGISYIMRENQANAQDDVVYAGQGTKAGECGAHIRRIREEWNGNVTCLLPPQSGNIEISATMKLLVARAPGEVQLIMPSQPVFQEGHRFDSQCVVPDGRPAAKITWVLDDTRILTDLHQPILTPPTAEDLQTISQNISRTLTADDDGRRLTCRAEHAALPRPREASRQLNVHYPPKRLESGQITIFGLKLSAEGRLNVTVRANPPPAVEWTVSGRTLEAGRRTEDGSMMALEPQPLGGGYYNVTLILLRVSKEDVDRVYYLKVVNDLGQEDFSVRISTMDEPAGTPRTCPEHWVACSTGRCVPPQWVCDGSKLCPGGEDEQNCGTPRTCPEHWVACSTGSCLPPYWACDGDKHCPGGEDEQNCGTPRTCPEHHVACSTGRCVPPQSVCDGDKDCPDGEDEQNCGTPRTCPEHWVACSTGRCVPPQWVCDGSKLCPGGEDEQNCGTPRTCPEHDVACSTGRCVPPEWVCDGIKLCPGGEDEQNCDTPRTCPEHYVACSTGRCVPPALVCDGRKECPGGEDEQNCGSLLNATTTTSTTTTEKVLSTEATTATRTTGSSKDRCVVPLQPEGGYYTIEDGAAQQPGVHVADLHLYFTCDSGYRLIGSQTVRCHQGTWTSEIPTCQRLCRLNPHVSVDYDCTIVEGGVIIGSRACGLFVPQGTVVHPRCRSPYYYYPFMLRPMHCIDGNWDYVAVCEPECGKVTPDGVILQIGARSAKLGELPWHAGIYDKHRTPYMQVCGGSLVSATMVISAAHCFWNEATTSPHPASKYAVALGKIYRPWNNPHDTSSQQFDVKEIKLTPRFRGSMTLFQEDIALVLLSRPAVYQNNVRPVCVDFDANFDRSQLDTGKMGKIAGWGLTEPNGNQSQVLRVLELPTVSITECLNKSAVSFIPYISSDKFCAGHWNGTKALCRGDSGGGLAFARPEWGSERYFLLGVASTAPSAAENGHCNAHTITTFTQISRHESFIKQYLLL